MSKVSNTIYIKNKNEGSNESVKLIKELDKFGIFKKPRTNKRQKKEFKEEIKQDNEMPGFTEILKQPQFRNLNVPPIINNQQAIEDVKREYANRFSLLQNNVMTGLEQLQNSRIRQQEPFRDTSKVEFFEEPYDPFKRETNYLEDDVPDTNDFDLTNVGTSKDAFESVEAGIDVGEIPLNTFPGEEEEFIIPPAVVETEQTPRRKKGKKAELIIEDDDEDLVVKPLTEEEQKVEPVKETPRTKRSKLTKSMLRKIYDDYGIEEKPTIENSKSEIEEYYYYISDKYSEDIDDNVLNSKNKMLTAINNILYDIANDI